MNIQEAKQSLDKVIAKARVYLYKPIQVAEILYRDRVKKEINLADLETYRNTSKRWRDIICLRFLGRTSTYSARYQDDIFNDNAIPPQVLVALGEENRKNKGNEPGLRRSIDKIYEIVVYGSTAIGISKIWKYHIELPQ